MKIAINTLSAHTSGNAVYAKMLIHYLSKIDRETSYLIVGRPNQINDFHVKSHNFQYLSVSFRSQIHRLIWEQLQLPRLLRSHSIDLIYTLSSIDIFFSPCPTIIKFANMLLFQKDTLKQERGFKRRLLPLRWLTIISRRTASHVITMSKTAERYLIEKHNFDPEKTTGILHSADITNLQSETYPDYIQKWKSKRYILTVSHINRYKHIMEILVAYAGYYRDMEVMHANKEVPEMLIAGGTGDEKCGDKKYYSELKRFRNDNPILREKVTFLGNVPRNYLSPLFKNCEFFIFASEAETCPRTLIEALKCGCAILCSNLSVMPEICQDAALYFDPKDPGDLKEKMIRITTNCSLKESLQKSSQIRSQDFDWLSTARKTLQIFQNVDKKGGGIEKRQRRSKEALPVS